MSKNDHIKRLPIYLIKVILVVGLLNFGKTNDINSGKIFETKKKNNWKEGKLDLP
jgi:hypothetical protein